MSLDKRALARQGQFVRPKLEARYIRFLRANHKASAANPEFAEERAAKIGRTSEPEPRGSAGEACVERLRWRNDPKGLAESAFPDGLRVAAAWKCAREAAPSAPRLRSGGLLS